MKIWILTMLLVIFSSFNSFGQKKTTTKEIEIMVNKVGIDSARKFLGSGLSDIYMIDSDIALSIAIQCNELNEYSYQLDYFSIIGQTIRNKTLNEKATKELNAYKDIFHGSSNAKYKHFTIPDKIIHVLLFQNDTNSIKLFQANYDFWKKRADSIKQHYPPAIKRFFQRFKGQPPSEELYSMCKENCYKLAWGLSCWQVPDFPLSRVNAIQQQLMPPHLRNNRLETAGYKPYQVFVDTIKLKRDYVSVDEIEFDNEPGFVKLNNRLEGEKCWKQIITNKKKGLYEIGCQWAHLAGIGYTYELELSDNNKLIVKMIDGWRS